MEPLSLSSNAESLSYTGGSSGQWSVHAGVDSGGASSDQWSVHASVETGGASSDHWSVHADVDSSWSSNIDMSSGRQQSSFYSTDQQFVQFDARQFQSLPHTGATHTFSVECGQVEPSHLSLESQVIGCNAEHLLLPSTQTPAVAADDMAWHTAVVWSQLSASAGPAVEHTAPIPAFVSNASYDGMCFM